MASKNQFVMNQSVILITYTLYTENSHSQFPWAQLKTKENRTKTLVNIFSDFQLIF